MKKKLLATTLTLTLLTSFSAQAIESSTMDKVKEYGIPCAISILAGLAVKKGVILGAGVCGAISYKTYSDNKKEKQPLSQEELKKVEKIVADSMDRLGIEKEKKLDEKAKQIEASQAKQIEEMRNILREVLADRMIKMEDDMKVSLQKQMESGDLMPKLEANLKELVKKEVISESRARQKEIVDRAVELTIKEVISKPVGVQDNQTGIQE